MTSSLVGSEMCIRDSLLSGSPASNAGPPPSSAAPAEPCAAPDAHARKLVCLLYTSDAADDM
eukprot:11329901-Prorocentrum_lima.AAC.1